MVTCLKMWSNWDIVIVGYNEDDLDEIQGPHVAMSLEWWESDWGSYLQLTSRRFHIGVLLVKYYNLSRMVGYTVCSLSSFFFLAGMDNGYWKSENIVKLGLNMGQHGSTRVNMGQRFKIGLEICEMSFKPTNCRSPAPQPTSAKVSRRAFADAASPGLAVTWPPKR